MIEGRLEVRERLGGGAEVLLPGGGVGRWAHSIAFSDRTE
jgi:hypothetical protein